MKGQKFIVLLAIFKILITHGYAQKQTITKSVDFYFCQQTTLSGVQEIDETGNPIKATKDAKYYFYYTPKIKNIKLKNIFIDQKTKNFTITKKKENKINIEWSDGVIVTTESIIPKSKYPIYEIIIKEDSKIQLTNKTTSKYKDHELIISYYQNNILKYLSVKSIYQLPSIPMP